MEFRSFPKLWALGQPHIKTIFDGEVEITEKVDGSQFGFMKTEEGEIICRSKGKILDKHNPEKMFLKGVEYVNSIKDILPAGFQFYGEYLNKPKHNTLAYDRIPKNHIALFGCITPKLEYVDDYEQLKFFADEFDINVVPLIFSGKFEGTIDDLLDNVSFLGGQQIEGVVVKNYNQSYMLGGKFFPIMGGKFVSEKFKEIHQKTWKKENTGKGKWETFCEQFQSEARWNKAIQHLKERGEFEQSPRDIGNLIKEIQNDIIEEELDNIKEALWNIHKRELLNASVKGFPEWFKKELIKMD